MIYYVLPKSITINKENTYIDPSRVGYARIACGFPEYIMYILRKGGFHLNNFGSKKQTKHRRTRQRKSGVHAASQRKA